MYCTAVRRHKPLLLSRALHNFFIWEGKVTEVENMFAQQSFALVGGGGGAPQEIFAIIGVLRHIVVHSQYRTVAWPGHRGCYGTAWTHCVYTNFCAWCKSI